MTRPILSFSAFTAATILIVFLSTPAYSKGYRITGSALQVLCEMKEDTACKYYILGASEAHADSFCEPEWADANVMKSVVVKYMDGKAGVDIFFYNASVLVVSALRNAFPCNK